MAKRIARAPDWLGAGVDDVYSVSACISEDFADYINDWEHNGYWLFDSPDVIRPLAGRKAISLADTGLFYYEVYGLQFMEEEGKWQAFGPEPSFPLNVATPHAARREGYDVVSFSAQAGPECSPLSCNGLAKEIATNHHCLLGTFDDAKRLLETGRFEHCEPGPYRIFAVHAAEWP